MKKNVFLYCLVLMLALSFFGTKAHADTTTSCTSSSSSCFNGFEYDTSSVTSAYADILTPTYPANYSKSATEAWVMITNASTKWVQVGWISSNTELGNYGSQTINVPNGVHYFYEINYGCYQCDYQVFNAVGPSQNSTRGYRVSLVNGNWVGTEADAQIGSFSTNYESSSPLNSGTGGVFSEELVSDSNNAYGSAFAGTAASHARFSNVRLYNPSTGTTIYSPGGTTYFTDQDAGQSFSHYGNTSLYSDQSSSYVDFWDTRF